ncbi:tetratricopeptide repeat protein [Flavicella sediminum]|uniref:tetratricopeptide repeat protein n=1 Tax=Flavicella sediminum TaxID=2585141 RepID=UPI001FB60397|nr:tetratricopeptide repeat protein [Flavicella sediminum]
MMNVKITNTKKFFLLGWLSFCFFLCSGVGIAQTNEALFDQANELYRTNKYTEAISVYKKLETKNLVSSELYFNLGNAYYKLNKVAESIYYFEKALLVNPLNEDARVNLVFAKRMTIDAIEELPKTLFQNIETEFVEKLSYNQWAWVAVISSLAMGLFFMLYYFSYIPTRKRLYFVSTIVTVLLLIVSLLLTFKEFGKSQNNLEAIIFHENVSVKVSPTDSSEEAFELHEGTKVFVLDKVADWKKIRLADGKIGWLTKEAIREL